jgi:hypothetical protein
MSLSLITTGGYQKGAYAFPENEIPTNEKNGEWCRQWCEAIYATWVSDRAGLLYSTNEQFQELRRYGAGKQSIHKYQDILLDESEENDGEIKGYLNINWEIFSIMPKFKHVIRGIFEDQDHSIIATAVDPSSIEDKETAKLKKWFNAKYKPVLDQVRSMTGERPQPEWLPETADELEYYQSIGGFKMAKETEIEEALQYTFYLSDWKETKRKIIDDFADINCAAVKDFTDTYTKKAKIRYVDPARFIIQYSKHWDHRNSEYAGELIQESISNIRKNTDLSEDQLRDLAHLYNGRYANGTLDSWSGDDLGNLDGNGWRYDDFMIDVMDAEWFTINQKNFTTRINERGETRRYEEESGKIHNSKKKKTETTKYKTVYRGKWIIGTEYIYDYGLQYDIPRPGKKEVELSYKFYKLPGRSLVDLCVPNLDAMQLTWLKLQNAIAMSSNSGIAVEFTSLSNMSLAGKKLDPMEILSIRRDTGDLIYKTTTHKGVPNVPGGRNPIQQLVGGIGPQLGEFVTLFELNLNFIREFTGINEIVSASNPNPEQSVGGSEIAVAASNNALKPLYSGYLRLKELSARSAALRIQLLLRHDKEAYNGYIPVVGGVGVKVLATSTDVLDVDYSIMIQARPTKQRVQAIMQAATIAMQPDKDGNSGIELKDFLKIEQMLENGNEKMAETYLNHESKKNKKRQLQVQQENMQLNSKNEQQTAAVKAKLEQEGKTFVSKLKIQEETAKADLEDRNAAREFEREKELEGMRLVYEKQQSLRQENNSQEKQTLKTA